MVKIIETSSFRWKELELELQKQKSLQNVFVLTEKFSKIIFMNKNWCSVNFKKEVLAV